jgi:hypothetical protein
MKNIATFPFLVFAFSFVALWFSAIVGTFFRKRLRALKVDQRDFDNREWLRIIPAPWFPLADSPGPSRIYELVVSNNFARLLISVALASPITK